MDIGRISSEVDSGRISRSGEVDSGRTSSEVVSGRISLLRWIVAE